MADGVSHPPVALALFKRRLILANVGALAVLLAAAVLLANSSHQAHEARARHAAALSAQTLSRDVGAGLRRVDEGLQSLLKRLDELQARGTPDPRELARVAAEERARLPMLDALRVTDAGGLVLNPGDRPAISMADRDYFRAARADPTRTVISEPLRGRVIGGWGLAIARARVAADGSFAGVVYASLKAERLRDEFKRADIGRLGAVTLRSRSLQLIARYSPLDANPETGTGTTKVSDDLLAALAQDPLRGGFMARASLDGVERVVAYEAVPGYPMLLLVGLATEDVLADWRRDAGLIAAGLVLLQALLAAGSVALYRRCRRARAQPPG